MLQKSNRMIQSEETRAKIIEAATGLFLRKGFFATSIADLASAVALTKGALYHHFENKDAILRAVVETIKGKWRSSVGRQALLTKDPLGTLSNLLKSHARFLQENESFCLVMNGLAMEMEGVDPGYLELALSGYSDLARFIERIICAGQQDGKIRADLDPALCSLTIVGMLRGTGCARPLSEKLHFDHIATMDVLEKLVIKGLKA